MLDIQLIRNDPETVRIAMRHKGYDPGVVDDLLQIDSAWRDNRTHLQEAQTEINTISKQIGELFRTGQKDQAEAAREKSSQLKQSIRDLEDKARDLDQERYRLLLEIPNVPHNSVPVGKTPEENEVVYTWGTQPSFDFEAKPHWDIIDRLELVDFDRGSKVTGGGFPFYKGNGARLQRALLNFFLDRATSAGYVEMQAPLLVNEDSGIGTGQIPDKEGQMYGIERDGFYMIPTAEVPITNYHRDEIFEESQLPIRYCGYTPCFRREAGSYGKDVRGLNRLHQFDKVELVHFVRPESSYEELENLRQHAENLLKELEIPYRRLLMCTGDMGFTQSKKYDLEVWSAGQERWLEVSSISNFESFQARRANIRYRSEESRKPDFVHTLNGSALAFPRILAAIIENNQAEDGSVAVPSALQPYMGFEKIS